MSVRRHVDRPWGTLGDAKWRHWTEEVARDGPEATIRVSRGLWAHMRRVRPDWPSDAERAADLAHHLELKGWLARAAGAFGPFSDQ